MAKCIFRERVSPPAKLLGAISCLAAIGTCMLLDSAIAVVLAPINPPFAFLIAFLAISAAGYLVGWLTYGARIKITTGGGIGYEQGVVLSALGASHSGRLYVPACDIVNIEDYTFCQPLLQSIFRPFALQEQSGGFVIKLPGYQGSGIRVTYTHPALVDSGRTESQLYLPTKSPAVIKEILLSTNP